jgi:ATP-dependent RNA helicase DeaD
MDTQDTVNSVTFAGLNLGDALLAALAQLGYEEPTPIQREAIPPLLEGRDLLGQAATGTGKTAAFALPLLQRIAAEGRGREPSALVLVPTRELAMQVAEAAHKYGRGLGARVLPIYGGQPIGRQLRELERGVDIVVATPGRALDHLKRGTLPLGSIRCIVLDEADEMLDMGFAEDIDAILADAPTERQTVLFSATMPPRIESIARRHLRNAVRISIAAPRVDDASAAQVRQTAYIVRRAHKTAALGRILDIEAPDAAIVFCRTRTEVDELTETLSGRGYRAEALHGGMSQEQRDRVMGRLRSGTAELLIATDVAARGLDVEHLTHVVNFDVPSAPEAYVHRIGRVGRAGRSGVAITLAEPREHRLLKQIERVAGRRIEIAKVPTVADLRTRRLELTRAAVRETLLEDDFEEFRVVIETLADEFDVMDVALAALKLAYAAEGEVADEEEIPDASERRYEERIGRGAGGHAGGRERGERVERGGRDEGGARARPRRGGPAAARIFIGAGRQAGIRPQDLVGAIANEAGIRGREIGAIEISERHSIVEVAEDVAQEVINAMRGTTLKGRKVTVRRDTR